MSAALRFVCAGLVPKVSSTSALSSKLSSALAPSSSLLTKTRSNLGPITTTTSSASIVSVAKQDESFIRPPPFDYKRKKFTKIHRTHSYLDPTYIRMNPNSKVVTVEGNIASGKELVAKELAERFDWYYMKEPRLDQDLYISLQGFDYRTLNKLLAPKLQALDEKGFYENPKHLAVPWMQLQNYRIRYVQYIDALAHLFSTGQGVILERCPASEFVFVDALYKHGLFPKDAYDYYFRLRYDTIHYLLRPHLIIYLDVDPEVSLKRIKERGIPHEVNTTVLTKEYLETIHESYTARYLPDAAQYSELLCFKWNQPGSIDEIVESIEALNMDDWDVTESKFKDWNFFDHSQWASVRYTYASEKAKLLDKFNYTPDYDVDSIVMDWADCEHRDAVFERFVPNYGHEQHDLSRGWLKYIFHRSTWWESQNFVCRTPYL